MEILSFSSISKGFNYSQAKKNSFIGWGSKILINWNLYKADIKLISFFFIPYIKRGQIQENKVMSKTGLKHKLPEFVLRLIYILLAFQSPESEKFTRMWFLVLRTMATWSHNCGLVKFPGFLWHEVALLLTCIN